MSKRFVIGYIFLSFQVLSIIYARVTPERFFCWAPYDEHTRFEVLVEIEGKAITGKEVKNRYRYRPIDIGWESRSINNVFNIINQYESSYGKNDKAVVKIKYSTNGKKEKVWLRKN
jgi:hypothetical protein